MDHMMNPIPRRKESKQIGESLDNYIIFQHGPGHEHGLMIRLETLVLRLRQHQGTYHIDTLAAQPSRMIF
jgi:hypothetical protein